MCEMESEKGKVKMLVTVPVTTEQLSAADILSINEKGERSLFVEFIHISTNVLKESTS